MRVVNNYDSFDIENSLGECIISFSNSYTYNIYGDFVIVLKDNKLEKMYGENGECFPGCVYIDYSVTSYNIRFTINYIKYNQVICCGFTFKNLHWIIIGDYTYFICPYFVNRNSIEDDLGIYNYVKSSNIHIFSLNNRVFYRGKEVFNRPKNSMDISYHFYYYYRDGKTFICSNDDLIKIEIDCRSLREEQMGINYILSDNRNCYVISGDKIGFIKNANYIYDYYFLINSVKYKLDKFFNLVSFDIGVSYDNIISIIDNDYNILCDKYVVKIPII